MVSLPLLPKLALNLQSSYLYFRSSRDYRCVILYLALPKHF
jgi:hypothetical protein